ncbi:UDP-2,4-diacetamido-2,4,6-trideoxy-beta-L-altropy ranose hydrolase [Pseudoalteromonas sp. A25]|uniref:UDP-2,4-diacetamido-2,4, 6-trideoxy-beta-L-altropyranose hydrolase n=1 Tax=Pseudoalteromonas sp. A25 TaxID=116092 RepID=UPI001260E2A3|nr:UDP-2,4-diacetamido-2,4,6-trideoxy-beta-L-altropyranose hydrolase [Pseudoalteromonas sp. A25]BBN81095.1 UDP-2,4-diacetamido-2,4,6-trideoxy-beta-L-altropy ranose hydrolase [Pseudoalteromonas sp. A25]
MFNIAIRVDVDATIGAGHFMRCLALAIGVKNDLTKADIDHQIHFICATINDTYIAKLSEYEFALTTIPHPDDEEDWLSNDSTKTAQALEQHVHLLIVDSYRISTPWYSCAIQKTCEKILVIDDLADRPHQCDFLLDQTLDASDKRYTKLVPAKCTLLVGQPFMLLREEFAQWRNKALAKRKTTQQIESVLIALGGSDAVELNLQAIDAVIDINQMRPEPLKVSLVVSNNSRAIAQYYQLQHQYSWLTVHADANNMAELMYTADIAIGASGSSAWERCSQGLPTLAIELADNQSLVLKKLADRGAVVNLGRVSSSTGLDIKNALNSLINSPDTYRAMCKQSAMCCDGNGVKRAVTALNLSSIYLRPATMADKALLFKWQSQKSVRQYARTNHQITYAEHSAWFDTVMKNSDRHLFIITERWSEECEKPVGMLRLDLQQTQYEISILTCPTQQGRGIAAKAIAAIEPQFKTRPILATVHPDNHASQALFSKAGFKKVAKDLFILENE